jgi:hypothetical protein
MGTKNNPGAFDCYAAAKPDEPMFILLGRDPMAASLVHLWALARAQLGENPAKVSEALDCATALEAWAKDMGKTPQGVLSDRDVAELAIRLLKKFVPNARLDRKPTHEENIAHELALFAAGRVEAFAEVIEHLKRLQRDVTPVALAIMHGLMGEVETLSKRSSTKP